MKLKLQTIILLLLLCPLFLIGQRTISGTVTDFETGEGLIGASVLIVGTSNGAVTDFM